MSDKKYYIKNVCEIGKLQYQDVLDTIKEVDSTFKPRGGLNTELEFELFKTVCQKHSIEVDDDGSITVHKTTDGAKINFAPHTVAKPAVKMISYHERALEEYNKLKCDKVDPLKVYAEMKQLPADVGIAFKVVEAMPAEKTILNDRLIHDFDYLKALFNQYSFAIIPINLGKRIREKINPFFTKVYYTNSFNNKMITFNKEKALHAFIINV
jgi:hypothetical protein